MTKVMVYLLGKLTKEMLVNIVIQNYEAVFPDPEEKKEAFREMAVLIQAREVYLGNRKLDGFEEPFKKEVQKYLNEFESSSLTFQKSLYEKSQVRRE